MTSTKLFLDFTEVNDLNTMFVEVIEFGESTYSLTHLVEMYTSLSLFSHIKGALSLSLPHVTHVLIISRNLR